jgi:alpha-tubulin suppressor-like RCC1 family protein
VTKFSTNGAHCLVLKNGNVLAWGDNQDGDLGNGSFVPSGLPVQVEVSAGVPLSDVIDIAAGLTHSAALTKSGSVYVWGTNTDGALGDGTTSRRTRAVVVTDASGKPLSGVVAIAAGQNSTLFLMSDGTVLMTGNNTYGQQGGAPANAYHPSATNITSVDRAALTFNHILVRRTDGSVWSWGYDNSYQLGNPARTQISQPIPGHVSGI